jgi:heme iron utilization protein
MPVDKSADKPATLSDSGHSTGYTARQLLRQSTVATLATIDLATGAPYASLVMVATEPDATPVMLISGLARHTRNLVADPRSSLLVDSRTNGDDPLTSLRATFIGRARPEVTQHGRTRYLRRHPSAKDFAGFADFGFWSLEIAVAHTIAGFGRIQEVAGGQVTFSHPLIVVLADLEHKLIVTTGQGRTTSIDLEGLDLDTGERRLFPSPLVDLSSAESRIEAALRS